MMEPDAKEIPSDVANAIDRLSAVAPIGRRLQMLWSDPGQSVSDVVDMVRLDPVLTGKLLRLVNSSAYALAEPVTSLENAMTLLGMDTVRNLAVTDLVQDVMVWPPRDTQLTPLSFWNHCLACAVTTHTLVTDAGEGPKYGELDFAAGLLHDLGKLVLMQMYPDPYEVILRDSRRLGVSLWFAELAVLGFTHTRVGGMVARRWKFHPVIREVMEYHHAPYGTGARSPLVARVAQANALCRQYGLGNGGDPLGAEDAASAVPEPALTPEQGEDVMRRVQLEIQKLKVFMKLDEAGTDRTGGVHP